MSMKANPNAVEPFDASENSDAAMGGFLFGYDTAVINQLSGINKVHYFAKRVFMMATRRRSRIDNAVIDLDVRPVHRVVVAVVVAGDDEVLVRPAAVGARGREVHVVREDRTAVQQHLGVLRAELERHLLPLIRGKATGPGSSLDDTPSGIATETLKNLSPDLYLRQSPDPSASSALPRMR